MLNILDVHGWVLMRAAVMGAIRWAFKSEAWKPTKQVSDMFLCGILLYSYYNSHV